MRPMVALTDEVARMMVLAHLEQQFGRGASEYTGGCLKCGTPAPTLGSRFTVLERLETCYSSKPLEPGRYLVNGAEEGLSLAHPHQLKLRAEDGKEIVVGYAHALCQSSPRLCIDWRGVECDRSQPLQRFMPVVQSVPKRYIVH